MVRPIKPRLICIFPGIVYFKPRGIPLAALREVVLKVEEIEAIRLKDLEELSQEECAKKMDISRATFQRVLNSAKKKIADALVNGKAIRVEGGNYKIKRQHPTVCICLNCGNVQQKIPGIPCSRVRCNKCGFIMKRGD